MTFNIMTRERLQFSLRVVASRARGGGGEACRYSIIAVELIFDNARIRIASLNYCRRLEFIACSEQRQIINGERVPRRGSTLQILVCILRERGTKVARVAGPRKSLIRLYVQQSAQQKSGSTSHERVRYCPKLWRDCEEDRDKYREEWRDREEPSE